MMFRVVGSSSMSSTRGVGRRRSILRPASSRSRVGMFVSLPMCSPASAVLLRLRYRTRGRERGHPLA